MSSFFNSKNSDLLHISISLYILCTSDIFKFGEYSLNDPSADWESTEYTGGNPPLIAFAPPFKKLSKC